MHDSIIFGLRATGYGLDRFLGSRASRMSSVTDPAITLLRDLVAIDSVNPTLVPALAVRRDIARRLADELRAWGLIGRDHRRRCLAGRTSWACSRVERAADR